MIIQRFALIEIVMDELNLEGSTNRVNDGDFFL